MVFISCNASWGRSKSERNLQNLFCHSTMLLVFIPGIIFPKPYTSGRLFFAFSSLLGWIYAFTSTQQMELLSLFLA